MSQKESMFDRYGVELTFTRNVLATNPCDPNVMDTHILDKQRQLILEKSSINSQVNKYLNQIQISQDKGQEELDRLLDELENLLGTTFTPEQRKDAIAGKLMSLKETVSEQQYKGTTVFFWDKKTNRPCIGDHMIYGYLKAAGEAIARTQERENGKMLQSISYTSSIINQHVRCEEQFITFSEDIVRNEDGSPQFLQRSLRAKTAKGDRISLSKSEQVPSGARIKFTLKVLKGSPMTEEILRRLFSYGEVSGIGQWRNASYGIFSYDLMRL